MKVIKRQKLPSLSILIIIYRNQIKYFEEMVLQAESERLQKERENLILKQSVKDLKRKILEQEAKMSVAPKREYTAICTKDSCLII